MRRHGVHRACTRWSDILHAYVQVIPTAINNNNFSHFLSWNKKIYSAKYHTHGMCISIYGWWFTCIANRSFIFFFSLFHALQLQCSEQYNRKYGNIYYDNFIYYLDFFHERDQPQRHPHSKTQKTQHKSHQISFSLSLFLCRPSLWDFVSSFFVFFFLQ